MRTSFIKNLLIGFVMLFPLEWGCVTQETATREEVEQVQGRLQARQTNLSEEVLALKRNMDELRGDLDGMLRSSEKAAKENSTNAAVLSSRTQTLEKRIEELERQTAALRSDVSKIESRISERLGAQRKADLEKMDEKLKIVLEEVSKENERLWSQVRSLQTFSSKQGLANGFHIVRGGESLSQIASQYGVNVQALAKANNIKDQNSIRAGQRLRIPKAQ